MRWLALTLLVACSPSVPLCTPSDGGFVPFIRFGEDAGFAVSKPVAFGVAGHELQVPLNVPVVSSPCDDPLEATVSTVVTDAVGLDVPHTHSAVFSERGVYATVITFTPAGAGSHHLVARFDPALGLVQHDVSVARDGSKLPTELSVPASIFGNRLDHLQVTAHQAVINLRASTLEVARDGQNLQSLSGEHVWVSGDDVWVATSGTVALWRDTGAGGLERVAGVEQVFNTPLQSLSGDSQGVVVVRTAAAGGSPRFVTQLRINGAALETVAEWRLDHFANTPASCLLSAGRVLVWGADSLCFAADAGTSLDCTTVATVRGVDRGGVWATRDSKAVLERFEPGSLASAESIDAPPGQEWKSTTLPGRPASNGTTFTRDGGVTELVSFGPDLYQVLDGWAVRRSSSNLEFVRLP